MTSIWRITVLLALFFGWTANACNPFQKTCWCPSENGGREHQWLPQTTFYIERNEYSCRGSGSCVIQQCRPTVLHSCTSCRGADRITRELDTPGYIHRYDIFSFFVADGGDESCLSGLMGQTEDGLNTYATVIVPPHSTIEMSAGFINKRWT